VQITLDQVIQSGRERQKSGSGSTKMRRLSKASILVWIEREDFLRSSGKDGRPPTTNIPDAQQFKGRLRSHHKKLL